MNIVSRIDFAWAQLCMNGAVYFRDRYRRSGGVFSLRAWNWCLDRVFARGRREFDRRIRNAA